MTRLSVNINKIATLRNARGGEIPNVLKAATDCQRFGAQGITIHPRPDERHIRRKDVYEIKQIISTEFNIEGYPSPAFLEMVTKVKPDQVTLVPDPPDAITSNAGWDTVQHETFLKDVIAQLRETGIRPSVFIDTSIRNIENAAKTGAQRVELYTEPYASAFDKSPEQAIRPFKDAALAAKDAGLEINAGHDLNLQNLSWFISHIPFTKEVSIGHALIADALYFGLENTIQMYLNEIKKGTDKK